MATQQLMAVENASPVEYTNAQMDLIRKTVANGTTPLEFDLFMEVVRRTGLDPFMKQVYAIKRGDKLTIQTGIDGYRLLADRTERYAGSDKAVYDVEDATHPGKASVTVWKFVRDVRVPFSAEARWSEYCQRNRDGNPTGKWADMPYHMLAKCAEALALRKAFPAELSGMYTHEEMDQADNSPAAYVEATPAPAQAQPDRFSAPLRDKATLDLLVKLQRFTDADRRTELASAFAAIEAAGQRVTNKTLAAELQARIDEAADLSTLDTGAIGA